MRSSRMLHRAALVCFCLSFHLAFLFAQKMQNVSLARSEKTITISNGLLGVIIPSESAYKPGQPCPAPIQSFIYSDGSISDNTFNELSAWGKITDMKLKLVRNSTKLVTIRIEYSFIKNEFKYGKQSYPGGGAGNGFYHCTISVKRGEKTILIEEESDNDVEYYIKISDGLNPDMARYRGWSSRSVALGYEPSGKIYRPESERGYPLDATVNLNYSSTFLHPQLILWEPAGGEQDSGRYWQVFNSKQNDNANLFGFLQGKPSRLLGGKFSGVQLMVHSQKESREKKQMAELRFTIQRRGPDNSWHPRKRFQWAAFISKKSDLLAPEEQQPIANELNKISALGSVIEAYNTKPVKLVPAFYEGAVYMPKESVQALCQRIKTDEPFYRQVSLLDYRAKVIFDAWRYPDSARVLIKVLIDFSDKLQQSYQTGEGTYSFSYRYWMGTLRFKEYALYTSCIFADKTIKISQGEKRMLEQLVGMLARVVWDDDNVPLFPEAGVNLGPANMPFQYRNNGRIFFALLLAKDPEFLNRAKEAFKSVNDDINASVYANGSSFGSPHYTQATMDPILFSMLQLKQAGVGDLFKTNQKVRRFAQFYTTLITPPSVRFKRNRKLISFGDGSEESAVTFALLATGFDKIDPGLSGMLSSIFNNGPQRANISGLISLATDLTNKSSEDFKATTSNYSGYHSHFRTALNTKNETAIWVLNGDSLYDHRNDDAGEVAIYALEAPLSLSGSSFYSPSVTDARIKSVVVPAKEFPQWDQPNQPINERSLSNRTWPQSNVTAFASMGFSSSTTVTLKSRDQGIWERQVSIVHFNDDLPVVLFYDSLNGNTESIWSMTMMSDGAIETPVGSIAPPKRLFDNRSSKELPQATPSIFVKAGINKFSFVGQHWPLHFSGGIDWKLYTVSDKSVHFSLAQWATTWQNDIETSEFLQTNKRRYSEEQQILRLKSTMPFFNLILPYPKNIEPYKNEKIKYLGNNLVEIEQPTRRLFVTPTHYIAKAPQQLVMGLFRDLADCTFEGFRIHGGCMELEYAADTLKIRLHGNSGDRWIYLPFEVEPVMMVGMENSAKKSAAKSVLKINYSSASIDLNNGEKGYKEYLFKRVQPKLD